MKQVERSVRPRRRRLHCNHCGDTGYGDEGPRLNARARRRRGTRRGIATFRGGNEVGADCGRTRAAPFAVRAISTGCAQLRLETTCKRERLDDARRIRRRSRRESPAAQQQQQQQTELSHHHSMAKILAPACHYTLTGIKRERSSGVLCPRGRLRHLISRAMPRRAEGAPPAAAARRCSARRSRGTRSALRSHQGGARVRSASRSASRNPGQPAARRAGT